jgi:hypothetical protein
MSERVKLDLAELQRAPSPGGPFQKAPRADDRNTKDGSEAKLIAGAAIVQQGPPQLADNEHLRALGDRRTRLMGT